LKGHGIADALYPSGLTGIDAGYVVQHEVQEDRKH
jgi:hypothetical protein